MNHISLFSGIGGIDLAAHWAGFETVAFCEQDKYCQKVLAKHWPGVPIYDDVRTLSASTLARDGITGINLISGGYPCQPDSIAGRRLGKEDDRYLWPEMFRLIRETKPTWVLGENVANHINMGLDGVLSDLEAANYETQAFVIPACAVGAWHERERVFIVAHTNSQPKRGLQSGTQQAKPRPPLGNQYDVRDSWATRPDYRGMAYGIPRRVDRLRALGNAVVPQQVYPILKAIADYESEAA